MNPVQSNNRMRPMKVSRWLTRRRRCEQTGAPGLHRRFVLHPTCLSEANITLFARLSAPVPCAAALLDWSSLGDHFFLPVSDHFIGRWVGMWAYRCFEGVEWCWEVPSAASGEACRPLGSYQVLFINFGVRTQKIRRRILTVKLTVLTDLGV